MIDNLSIIFHAFNRCMLISISVDEILLPRYVNLSTTFRGLPLRVEMAPPHLKHVLCFIYLLTLGYAVGILLGLAYL